MIMGKRYQAPVCEVVVRPSGTGTETRLVLFAALLTVLVCGAAVVLRNTASTAKEVPEWQVDAFRDLGARELAIFNALYTAAPEIEMIHEEMGGWPTVDELAAEFIPPFVQDVSWKKSGAVNWYRKALAARDQHIVLYVGHPSGDAGMGSFLLVMLHDHVKKEGNAGVAPHAPYEVWIHASPMAEAPVSVTDQSLINKGWREVVARKGEEETRRTKEDFLQ